MIVYKCDICGAEYNDKKYVHMIPRKVRGGVIRPLVCNRCVCDLDQTLDKIIEALKKEGQTSAKEYREAFNFMTDEEHELMWNLFMSGENHDCHTWVTFGNVERVVGKIILGRTKNERKDGV